MARPTPWLPHLPEILQSVSVSNRTHFDRPALEEIFRIAPSTAGKLMKMLPRGDSLGASHLVERAVLVRFLEQLNEAGDSRSALTRQRKAPAKIYKRKPRTLVLNELVSDGRLIALPANVKLERGRLTIDFGSVLELCENLAMVAGSIGNEEQAFVDAYEPVQPPTEMQIRAAADKIEIQKLFEGLRAMQEKDSQRAPLPKAEEASRYEGHAITRE